MRGGWDYALTKNLTNYYVALRARRDNIRWGYVSAMNDHIIDSVSLYINQTIEETQKTATCRDTTVVNYVDEALDFGHELVGRR